MKLHLFFFVLTALSLFSAGLYSTGADPFVIAEITRAHLAGAALYMGALLLILGTHEGGHYIMAKRCGVDVSPPYFLPGLGPLPGLGVIPFFGTFGAFIKMELREMSAGDLARIAAWGPIAGFLVTAVAVFAGVALSTPEVFEGEGGLVLGDPLLIQMATGLFHPEMGESMELMLHPLALAGWVGCLLTALNLLPLGQLDGGHLLYSLLGESARRVVLVGLVGLGLLGLFYFPGWLILGGFVLVMGARHPAILEGKAGGKTAIRVSGVCLLIFVLTFTPTPVKGVDLSTLLGM